MILCIDESRFRRVYSQGGEESNISFLVDCYGNMVSFPQQGYHDTNLFPGRSGVMIGEEDMDVLKKASYDFISKIHYFRAGNLSVNALSILNGEFFIVNIQDLNYSLSKLRYLLIMICLVAGLVGAVCFLIVYYISQDTDRSVKKILKAMNEANRGNLDSKAVVEGNDEFARISEHFNDMLAEIKKANQQERESMASVIWPDMWQAVMDDGKYYGIPFSCDPYVLFSNTGYFEKKALDVPDNWNQVFEVCNSIDSSGIYGLGFGVRRTGDGARLYSSVLYICGGSYYSLDSSPGIRSLELFDTLKRWGYVDKNVINYTQTDIAREFADEKAAMIIAPISVKTYLDQLKSGISYRITAVPGEVREGYVLSGDNIGILKNGDRGALAFMGYLYQPEVRTRFLNATGTLPLFQAEAGEGGNDRDMLQLKKGFVNQGILLKSYNSWFEVSSILSEYVCSLLTKKNIDVPETARNLQDEVRVAIMNH